MRLIDLLRGALALLIVNGTAQTTEKQHARALLQRAVDYYQVQGDAAFAAFSRLGEFIDDEHYVFVVDTGGTMLASGGTSAVLIGRDVSEVMEHELLEAFQAVLNSNEDGQVRSVEYRWTNTREGRVESKQVVYRRVGERVIAVSLHLPRATPAQADKFLDRVAAALSRNAQQTIADINDLSANYHEDDLYAFVIDLDTRRYVAHGYNKRLVGADFSSIKDPEGNPVGEPILALISKAERAGYDYRWKNPVTSKVEDKHALLRKVGDYLVAVGYYRKGQ
jgi:cytochrome c